MPATKVYSELFAAATVVAAGKLKSDPVVSNVVDVRNDYGGDFIFRIINTGPVTAPCTIMFQTSAVGGTDAANWFDFYPVTCTDLTASANFSGSYLSLPKGHFYVRAIAYGNVGSSSAVHAGIMRTTGL